jgi:hypothetical protein
MDVDIECFNFEWFVGSSLKKNFILDLANVQICDTIGRKKKCELKYV